MVIGSCSCFGLPLVLSIISVLHRRATDLIAFSIVVSIAAYWIVMFAGVLYS